MSAPPSNPRARAKARKAKGQQGKPPPQPGAPKRHGVWEKVTWKLFQYRLELGFLLALAAAYYWLHRLVGEPRLAAAALGLVCAAAITLIKRHEPSARWVRDAQAAAKVKRQWTRAVQVNGGAPVPSANSGQAYSVTGPVATKAVRTPIGWKLTVRFPDNTSLDTLKRIQPKLEASLNCAIEMYHQGSERNRATVVLRNRDPFEKAASMPWPDLGLKLMSVHDTLRFGRDEEGDEVLVRWTAGTAGHILLCGETGSGKSVALRLFLSQIARDPNAHVILLDPNRIQLSRWNGVARKATYGRDIDAAIGCLRFVQVIMEERLATLAGEDKDHIDDSDPTYHVVIDELASYVLHKNAKKAAEFTDCLLELLQAGRAAGIRIIAVIQRPSATILSTDVRAQFTYRIAYRTDNAETTEMILASRQWPAHKIMRGQPGVAYVQVEGGSTKRMRTYEVTKEETKEIVSQAAGVRAEHDKEQMNAAGTVATVEPPAVTEPGEKLSATEARLRRDKAILLAAFQEAFVKGAGPLTVKQLEKIVGAEYGEPRRDKRQWYSQLQSLVDEGVVTRLDRDRQQDPFRFELAVQGFAPESHNGGDEPSSSG